ncbi:MAG: hypothetical protein LBH77_03015, partial [Tannerella sp.]|nr:hypothetical protein [Tannerella sp.]
MKTKLLLITGMLFGILSLGHADLTVDLGGAAETSGTYTFPNATVTADAGTDRGYVIWFMFTRATSTGDLITLPPFLIGLPSNWTVNSNSSSNYVKVINAPNANSGATAAQIQAFLRQIQVKYASGKKGQGVTVIISKDVNDAGRNIYYSSDTEHYYEYVALKTDWRSAYNAALKRRFMGLKGYLAVITSLEEQTLLASIASGKYGWLGGTRARLTFNANGEVTGHNVADSDNYWYWATGPEFNDPDKGNRDPTKSVFYRKLTHKDAAENTTVSLAYPYTCWNDEEPNNSSTEYMLHLFKNGNWNDYTYNNNDINGYMVEYYEDELEGASSSTTIGFNCTKTAAVGNAANAAGTSA